MTPVRLEPTASPSQVNHSTTEPLRSPDFITWLYITLDAMSCDKMYFYFLNLIFVSVMEMERLSDDRNTGKLHRSR